MHIISPEEARRDLERRIAQANAAITIADYNKALEDYLLEVRTARGYDTREPSDYKDSSIPRWAQDAVDWIAFRDAVMVYALGILNQYESTGVPPVSLRQFTDALHEIHCDWHD